MSENHFLILIIDDDEYIRDSCRQVLEKIPGAEIEEAKNGQSGLSAMQVHPADVVLLDLKMPGMSGMEVLEVLRRDYPDTVVNVITGYATVESAVDAMKRGAFDFLPKPFTPVELRIIIDRALKRHRLILETRQLKREKEQLKEDMISIVTHQMREPLVVITQYLETVREGITGEISDQTQKLLTKAQGYAEDLLKLTQHWLNFARMDGFRVKENRTSLRLEPLLEKIVEGIKPLAQKEDIGVILSLPESLPPVLAETQSMEVILGNLVSNAVKYNIRGGKVWITTKTLEHHLEITVKDTGLGIAKENLTYLFEPFFRIKDKERQKIAGTGLGLSIAQMLIDAQGGSISVNSEPGKGSSFIIQIPLAKNDTNIS